MAATTSQRRFLCFGMTMVPTPYCHLAQPAKAGLQIIKQLTCNSLAMARWQYAVGTILIPKYRNRRWLAAAPTSFPLYPCPNNFSREVAVIEPRTHFIARHEHCALRRRGCRGRRRPNNNEVFVFCCEGLINDLPITGCLLCHVAQDWEMKKSKECICLQKQASLNQMDEDATMESTKGGSHKG